MSEVRDMSAVQQKSVDLIADKFFSKIEGETKEDIDVFKQALTKALIENNNSATGYDDSAEKNLIMSHLQNTYESFNPGKTAPDGFFTEVLGADDHIAEWHGRAMQDGVISTEEWAEYEGLANKGSNAEGFSNTLEVLEKSNARDILDAVKGIKEPEQTEGEGDYKLGEGKGASAAQKKLASIFDRVDNNGWTGDGKISMNAVKKVASLTDLDDEAWEGIEDNKDEREGLREVAIILAGPELAQELYGIKLTDDEIAAHELFKEYAGSDGVVSKEEFKQAIENPEKIKG